MAVVKTVSSGQPITAGWANSLVHEVNTEAGMRLRGQAANSISLRPVRAVNDPAWQIRYSNGIYSLNAGQVYINGVLIDGEHGGSYNQFSSASNWETTHNYTPKSADDLPIWYLVIQCPKIVTSANIGEVSCVLVVGNKGSNPPTKEDSNDKRDFHVIQLNKVEGMNVVQVISGTIYLQQNTLSLVGGDGIIVTSDTESNIHTVSLYVSFIGEDGIDVIVGYEPEQKEEGETETESGNGEGESESGENETPEKPLKVVKIRNTTPPLSFIAGDGIEIQDTTWAEDISEEGSEQPIWKHTRVITINGESLSFVGEDGIVVTEEIHEETTQEEGQEPVTTQQKVIKISGSAMDMSFIGEDGITVTEGTAEVSTTDPETGEENTETVKTVTISGNSKEFSFVGEDGITITETTTENVTTVTIMGSGNKISIVGTDPITVTETTANDVTTYTVSATISPSETISIVAGDGIDVAYADNTYTISTTNSIITHDFDPEWFTVTDGVVTLNTAKLQEVANDIAANATVNVSVTGIVDEVSSGSVQVNSTGILAGEVDVTTGVTVV